MLVRYAGPQIFLNNFYVGATANHKADLDDKVAEFVQMQRKLGDFRYCMENQWKSIYHYQDQNLVVYHFQFRYSKDYNAAVRFFNGAKARGIQIFDEKISSIRQFLTAINGEHTIWYHSSHLYPTQDKISCLEEEYLLSRPPTPNPEGNFRTTPAILAFDIETYSADHDAFPNPLRPHDVIHLVSLVQKQRGSDQLRRILITTEPVGKIDLEVEVRTVPDEISLIEEFTRAVADLDPDILTGYNIFKFDFFYLYQRHQMLSNGAPWPNKLGRLLNQGPKFGVNYWVDKTETIKSIPGRVVLDMYKVMLNLEAGLSSHRLDFVANHFLGRGKLDISAKKMFAVFQEMGLVKRALANGLVDPTKSEFAIGDFFPQINPEVSREVISRWNRLLGEYALVAKYCLLDSELVLEIMDKATTWITLVEFSNSFGIPMEEVFLAGSQGKVVALIYNEAHRQNFLLPTIDRVSETYKGAAIREPIMGVNGPTYCLDFNSLYPSLIIKLNACYTTHLKSPEGWSPDQYNAEPVIDDQGNVLETIYFLKREIKPGILPLLCERLLRERREIRHQGRLTKDKVLADILDKRQLALKVMVNAVYGFTGMGVKKPGRLPMLAISSAVTAAGRTLIRATMARLEEELRATIIYGDTDSVMFTLPTAPNYDEAMINTGFQVAKTVSSWWPDPLRMEFEKSGKILCISKKKYAYWLSDMKTGELRDPDDKNSFMHKGTVIVRRETIPFFQEIYEVAIMDILVRNLNPVEFLHRRVTELNRFLHGEHGYEAAILRNKYTGKNYANPNHAMKIYLDQLTERKIKPDVGERLEYIITKVARAEKLGEKYRPLSDYRSGILTDADVDYAYYISHKMVNQLQNLWERSYSGFIEQISRKFGDSNPEFVNFLANPFMVIKSELNQDRDLSAVIMAIEQMMRQNR